MNDGLEKLVHEICGSQVESNFLLAGGLSGAQIHLIRLDREALVLKIGPDSLIQLERENLSKLAGSPLHSKIIHPKDGEFEKKSLANGSRILAYRFVGTVPPMGAAPPDDMLAVARQYLAGDNRLLEGVVPQISNELQPLTNEKDAKLPEMLKPDWHKVDPFLATAEAMSSTAITRKRLRDAWESWSRARHAAVSAPVGIVHGDLRCANIVIAEGRAHLVDFGSVREDLGFVDLIRLEIDILLRWDGSNEDRGRLLDSAFEPLGWSTPSSPDHALRLIQVFRAEYIRQLGGPDARQHIQQDFYAAYLRELLRRVTYWEEEFLTIGSRQILWWLLEACVRRLGQHEEAMPSLAAYQRTVRPAVSAALGLRRAYFHEEENDARNTAKQSAILTSKGSITLMAHTGFSFLAPGGVHARCVRQFLDAGEEHRMRTILLNPFSVAAIQVCMNWIRSSPLDDFERHYKLQTALAGFKSLRRDYGGRVELRFTSFDLGCTVLSTETGCFVEPYLACDLRERSLKYLTTYELECDPSMGLARSLELTDDERATHMNFYWKHSIGYDDYVKTRSSQLDRVLISLESMIEFGQADEADARSVKEYLEMLRDAK